VIHKIKALHDSGDGLSCRQIARKLKISRNTVRKYLAMDEPQIAAQLEDCERTKQLDEYIVYIKHQLQNAPGLSAVKLKRRLMKKFDDVNVSIAEPGKRSMAIETRCLGKVSWMWCVAVIGMAYMLSAMRPKKARSL